MSCSFTEKISSLIDGELAPDEAREVERHVFTCGECEQVRADFLNLRSQIAGFETSPASVIHNRELKKILSRGERASVKGLRWGWSTPAIAFATLLVIGTIIGLLFYQTSNNNQRAPREIAVVATPSPAPSPEPTPEQTKEEPNTPKRVEHPSAPKKSLQREPKPGEQFASIPAAPERVRSADAETMTAIHFETSERLLLAFKNVRLDEPSAAWQVQ